jgi:LL-diaminopimelate aminotransferase
MDLINLGVGDPDLPTPEPIVRRLQKSAEDPKNHQYPSYEGMRAFREAVADWYRVRFNVPLDPGSEVLTLIGSKEGIGHLPLAFLNPGDRSLCPDPAYPVYSIGTMFAGGAPYFLPLRRENRFLPELDRIPASVLKRSRLLFINYPNNPTSAVADTGFFKKVVAFAKRHRLIVCHDAAYSEIYYDGLRPASFLEVEGARDVGIEFHSLSKTFNMTGWRIGFAVGNREIIAGLGKIKSNLDSGAFQAVQEAGIEALRLPDSVTDGIRRIYQERRDLFVPGLTALGLDVEIPKAAFYVWIRTPKRTGSSRFVQRLLTEAGIVSTPGQGFGAAGEGYIRMTLTVGTERLREALERLKRIL